MFLGRRLRLRPAAGLRLVTAAAPRILARDEIWVVLGLVVAFAAAWRVLATPGEIILGDREYPIAAELWLRKFVSAWDTSSGSTLITMSRTYVDAPWGLIVWTFGLSTEVAGKFHWMSWHLLGFFAGYVGARFLVSPRTRAAHPVAVRAGCWLAGLFWVLNPWILARSEQLHVWVSALMLPLFLGLIVSAARTSTRRGRAQRALAAAAVLAFAISASPHYMAVGVLVGVGWFAYAAIGARGSRRPILTTAAVFVLGYAVFAAFTLVPFVVASVGGSATGPAYIDTYESLPVARPVQSVAHTLTLTGVRSLSHWQKPPDPEALAGWRLAAMIPAALLLLALFRLPGHRLVLGYAVVLGGVTALFQIATYDEATRPAYLALVESAPYGWAVTEPGKLSGALALALFVGIAHAPIMFARDAPRRYPIVGTVQTVAIGVGLAAYVLPTVGWALLNEKAQLVPERFPASIRTAAEELDRRNADGRSRTLLAFPQHFRFPEWSSHRRVLHFPENGAVTSPYLMRSTVVGLTLSDQMLRDSPEMAATLRTHGVARVLVPTGTTGGRDLAERLHQSDSFALDFAEGYYEIFRTVEPPYPWVYEETSAGREELSWRREGMHRLVIEVPPAGEQAREIVTQELWDPLWAAELPQHVATVERSVRGLLTVRLEPGASGRLVLEYGLQRALIAGHAIAWTGLLAWAVWAAWPHRPRRLWERP